VDVFQQEKITHVLSVVDEPMSNSPAMMAARENRKHLMIELEDNPFENLLRSLGKRLSPGAGRGRSICALVSILMPVRSIAYSAFLVNNRLVGLGYLDQPQLSWLT
jgi:hypothetical protein